MHSFISWDKKQNLIPEQLAAVRDVSSSDISVSVGRKSTKNLKDKKKKRGAFHSQSSGSVGGGNSTAPKNKLTIVPKVKVSHKLQRNTF